jgi:hypothetical protein
MPLLAPLAMAFCSVPQPRLVCAEYFASQLVVEATLAQIKIIGDKSDPVGIEARVYTLDVNRVMRGRIVGSIQVYEGNDSGRATFDWTPGKKYLLFLSYVPRENAWGLDGCGNSGPLGKSKAALSEIEAIKAAHDGGVIYGVVSNQTLSIPINGIHVGAQGDGGKYAATTNEKGEFQMNVPAGQYSVRVVESGISFNEADISYVDPSRVQIEPGGCAQIQFAEVEGSQ